MSFQWLRLWSVKHMSVALGLNALGEKWIRNGHSRTAKASVVLQIPAQYCCIHVMPVLVLPLSLSKFVVSSCKFADPFSRCLHALLPYKKEFLCIVLVFQVMTLISLEMIWRYFKYKWTTNGNIPLVSVQASYCSTGMINTCLSFLIWNIFLLRFIQIHAHPKTGPGL